MFMAPTATCRRTTADKAMDRPATAGNKVMVRPAMTHKALVEVVPEDQVMAAQAWAGKVLAEGRDSADHRPTANTAAASAAGWVQTAPAPIAADKAASIAKA